MVVFSIGGNAVWLYSAVKTSSYHKIVQCFLVVFSTGNSTSSPYPRLHHQHEVLTIPAAKTDTEVELMAPTQRSLPSSEVMAMQTKSILVHGTDYSQPWAILVPLYSPPHYVFNFPFLLFILPCSLQLPRQPWGTEGNRSCMGSHVAHLLLIPNLSPFFSGGYLYLPSITEAVERPSALNRVIRGGSITPRIYCRCRVFYSNFFFSLLVSGVLQRK